MSAPVSWLAPVVAGVAAAVALAADPWRSIAVPAATVAVVAAALTVVEVVLRRRGGTESAYEPAPTHPGGLREAFVDGERGRVDIVLACDLLERRLSHPNLRSQTTLELDSVVRMSPAEFRAYLTRRLHDLERTS